MTVKTRVIKIFRAGRHTAMDGRAFDYPVQALEFCCAAYNALNTPTPRAPLVLGHPEVNWPTYGTVKRLSVLDGAMYAEAEMSPDLVQLVAHGHYKNVSASFYGVTHKLGGAVEFMALRHVGFLGAMPPAIKGLGPVTVDGYHTHVVRNFRRVQWNGRDPRLMAQNIEDVVRHDAGQPHEPDVRPQIDHRICLQRRIGMAIG